MSLQLATTWKLTLKILYTFVTWEIKLDKSAEYILMSPQSFKRRIRLESYNSYGHIHEMQARQKLLFSGIKNYLVSS